jgi:hypothetical protein
MRLGIVLAIGIWLLSAQGLSAEAGVTPYDALDEIPPSDDTSVEEAEPDEVDDTDEIKALTATREVLYDSAYWLVENVDSWFGDKPFEEEGRVSGAVRVRLLYREDDGYSTDSRFKLRVKMPNLSERAYVFIGRDNEQELVTDQSGAFTREQLLLPESRSNDQTFFVGLGYAVRDNLDFRAGVRGGYKLYTQARYRKAWWLTEASNVDYRQTVFLAVDDGLGTTTSLDYAYAFNPRTAFRWQNSGTFGTETDGIAWSTSLGLFRRVGGHRELSVEALANGETDDRIDTREYGVRGIWRRPIHQDWVVGELILGHFWPREDDDPERQRSWAVGIGVELMF